MISKRVLVIGWDGLRPDYISPELTPNVHKLISGGVRFAGATAVFPSETRPNNSTIGTGCFPGRHGITANPLFMRIGEAYRPIDSGRPDHLEAVRSHHGRILASDTLGEVMARGGHGLAAIGSGSPGQTILQNPHGAGWVINRAVRYPQSLDEAITATCGPWPERGTTINLVDDYLLDVTFDYVLPQLDPSAVILWSSEPDVQLHGHGLGSPEVAAALRANDERLGRILERLSRDKYAEQTTVLFVSDHGHTSIRGSIDLFAYLVEAGLADPQAPDDVVIAGAGVHLFGSALDRLREIAFWLTLQEWCGPVFVRDDCWTSAMTGTLPASVLWDGVPGPWMPEIQFSANWDDDSNAAGMPGYSYRIGKPSARLETYHGSLSPRDMGNVMAMSGAGVRSGVTVNAPSSTVDIAPTILDLLGITPPDWMQGRPLREALEGGPDEPPVTKETLLNGPWGCLVRRRVNGTAYVSVER